MPRVTYTISPATGIHQKKTKVLCQFFFATGIQNTKKISFLQGVDRICPGQVAKVASEPIPGETGETVMVFVIFRIVFESYTPENQHGI